MRVSRGCASLSTTARRIHPAVSVGAGSFTARSVPGPDTKTQSPCVNLIQAAIASDRGGQADRGGGVA